MTSEEIRQAARDHQDCALRKKQVEQLFEERRRLEHDLKNQQQIALTEKGNADDLQQDRDRLEREKIDTCMDHKGQKPLACLLCIQMGLELSQRKNKGLREALEAATGIECCVSRHSDCHVWRTARQVKDAYDAKGPLSVGGKQYLEEALAAAQEKPDE